MWKVSFLQLKQAFLGGESFQRPGRGSFSNSVRSLRFFLCGSENLICVKLTTLWVIFQFVSFRNLSSRWCRASLAWCFEQRSRSLNLRPHLMHANGNSELCARSLWAFNVYLFENFFLQTSQSVKDLCPNCFRCFINQYRVRNSRPHWRHLLVSSVLTSKWSAAACSR